VTRVWAWVRAAGRELTRGKPTPRDQKEASDFINTYCARDGRFNGQA